MYCIGFPWRKWIIQLSTRCIPKLTVLRLGFFCQKIIVLSQLWLCWISSSDLCKIMDQSYSPHNKFLRVSMGPNYLTYLRHIFQIFHAFVKFAAELWVALISRIFKLETCPCPFRFKLSLYVCKWLCIKELGSDTTKWIFQGGIPWEPHENITWRKGSES